MKMKKILAVALSCATMAMSISAFADTATYDAEKVSVAVATEDGSTIPTADQQLTVVVVPASFGAENATAENIYYINQAQAGDEFPAIIADMGLKGELTEGETYEVRIGGENLAEVIKLSFEVTSGEPTYMLGDPSGDGKISSLDIDAVVGHILGKAVLTGDNFLAGEITGDEKITSLDIDALVSHILGKALIESSN